VSVYSKADDKHSTDCSRGSFMQKNCAHFEESIKLCMDKL